ncbi:MAG TPA: hypothetical protein VKY39_08950, partial [Aggregatilineales bacterium]|nr:hypothetical protein [Aggregatilineales bacterium]
MFTEPVSFLGVVIPILAEIGLTLLLVVVLVVDLLFRPRRRQTVGVIAGVGMLVVMVANLMLSLFDVGGPAFAEPVLGGMVSFD